MSFISIWCVDANGLIIFNQEYRNKLNLDKINKIDFDEKNQNYQSELLSGLFSAIYTMSIVSIQEPLKEIRFKCSKLLFIKYQISEKLELFFIIRALNKIKNATLYKQLYKIKNRFIEVYGDQLMNCNGNISNFTEISRIKREFIV